MPTINARVAASTDDASEIVSGNVATNATSFNIDETGEWIGFRVNVTIPDGATIDAAYLTLEFDSGTLDEPDLTIYGEDTATPAAFSAGTATFTISGRSRTSASVNWGSTDLGGPGSFNTSSIVSIIEELMASYSYASGAYMSILLTSRANDANRDARIVLYDGSTTTAPLLHIEYTEGGGVTATAAITLAAATVSATATLALAGQAAITLDAAILSSAATLAIGAQAALTLDAATITSAAQLSLMGSAALTMAAATLSATGTLTSGASGTLNVTLDAATLTSAAQLALTGQAAITLDAATLNATGTLVAGAQGAVNVTLDAATVVSSGQLSIAAQAALALSPATLSSLGTLVIVGAATINLGAATLVSFGSEVEPEIQTIAVMLYGPSSTSELFGPSSTAEIGG